MVPSKSVKKMILGLVFMYGRVETVMATVDSEKDDVYRGQYATGEVKRSANCDALDASAVLILFVHAAPPWGGGPLNAAERKKHSIRHTWGMGRGPDVGLDRVSE
jgi:hypothetical protein